MKITTDMLSTTGKRLAQLRKDKGITQKKLAAELTSTSETIISYYETEARQIPVDMIIEFSKFFNVTTDYLLMLTNTKNISYSKTNEITGLSEQSIKILNNLTKDSQYDYIETINFIIENLLIKDLIGQITELLKIPFEIPINDFKDNDSYDEFDVYEKNYYINMPVQPKEFEIPHKFPVSTILFQYIIEILTNLFNEKRKSPEVKQAYIDKIKDETINRGSLKYSAY